MGRIGKKDTILVVDDEEMVGDTLTLTLNRLGYPAVTCSSPYEALRLFSREPERFDVAIVDEIMPEMRGTALATQLLRIKDDLPVILTTGYGNLISMEEVKAAGFRAVLLKPVLTEPLRMALEKVNTRRIQGA